MKKPLGKAVKNSKHIKNILADFAPDLQPLEDQFAFLPCNDQKRPLVKDWPNKSFSIDQIVKFPACEAIGVRTGFGRLLTIDLDGESSFYYLYDRGLIPQHCKTWQIHRSNDPFKIKLNFQLTPEQLAELPVKDFVSQRSTGAREQVEVFFSEGRQVIIIGKHPSRGRYFWPRGFEPDDLTAPPTDWWEYILEVSQGKHSVSKAKPNCNDWRRLTECPICGRNSRLICSVHKDLNTIRCYQGGEFSHPSGLAKGQIIKDIWAFSSEKYVGGLGTFSIFVRHNPRPISKLWSKVND